MKRWPAIDGGGNVELELRQVYELEEFGPSEAIERDCQLREELSKKLGAAAPE